MSVAVTGFGMVTSVGRDAATTCASLRAGLQRPSEIPYFQVLEDEDGGATPIIGYPIRGVTDGFYLPGLWIRLAEMCLTDLIGSGPLASGADAGFWGRTGLLLVTPYPDADRLPDLEELSLATPEEIAVSFGRRALELADLPIPQGNVAVVSQGHAGTAAAVATGIQSIEGGRLDRVLVLAVDSYLDEPTLEWLSSHGRLKTGDNPAGLVPGEACACFLLESEARARAREAPVQATVASAAAGLEPRHLFADEVNAGIELSNAMARVLAPDEPFAGDLFTDLNGEPWRAYELACARVRLEGRMAEDVSLVLPCESLGETGAASGAVAVCAAVRSFVRGYASSSQTLVVSSSEHGNVAAIRLTRA